MEFKTRIVITNLLYCESCLSSSFSDVALVAFVLSRHYDYQVLLSLWGFGKTKTENDCNTKRSLIIVIF